MATLIKDYSPIKKKHVTKRPNSYKSSSSKPSPAPAPAPTPNPPKEEFGSSSAGNLIEQLAAEQQINTGEVPLENQSVGPLQGGVTPGSPIDIREQTLIQAGAGNILEFSTTGITGIGGLGSFASTSTKNAASKLLSGGLENLIKEVGKKEVVVAGINTGKSALNSKTATLTGNILKSKFTVKALAVAGAWASAVFLGKWGQAEAPEPLSFVLKDLVRNAQETGNWTLVEEAQESRNEILDLAWWQEVGLWSPISPAIGIPQKIEGAITAALINDKYIEDLKTQQETGESDDERWARVREEQAMQEKELIDYYNQERMKLLDWEREAATEKRDADARFWASERAKERKKEAEDREAIAKFWTAYRKEAQKQSDNNRPSNLNFGLI